MKKNAAFFTFLYCILLSNVLQLRRNEGGLQTKKTATIVVRIEPDLKEKLIEAAKADKITLSRYIVSVLKKEVG